MQMSEYTRNRDMCELNTFHLPLSLFSYYLLLFFRPHSILYACNTNTRFMLIIWIVLMFHVVFITQQSCCCCQLIFKDFYFVIPLHNVMSVLDYRTISPFFLFLITRNLLYISNTRKIDYLNNICLDFEKINIY